MRKFLDMELPLLAIRCTTYNHESYIRDTLDGFVSQKTNFPFVAIVHDDASTDNTAAIIREYAEKYPDIIKPIFESENQYSKRNGSLGRIMDVAVYATGAKYIAMCEGDDYWIDPLKLQKQVDFLESHPDYTMCTTNIDYKENNGYIHPSIWNSKTDTDLSIKEIILNGGLYIGTASVVFRRNIYKQIPESMKKLHVGDYPLQIYMASKGKVRNLCDITCVYRYMSEGSWTQKNNTNICSIENLNNFVNNEQILLDTMDEITNYKFQSWFSDRSALFRFNCYYLYEPDISYQILKCNTKLILTNCSIKSIIFVCMPRILQKAIRKLFKR